MAVCGTDKNTLQKSTRCRCAPPSARTTASQPTHNYKSYGSIFLPSTERIQFHAGGTAAAVRLYDDEASGAHCTCVAPHFVVVPSSFSFFRRYTHCIESDRLLTRSLSTMHLAVWHPHPSQPPIRYTRVCPPHLHREILSLTTKFSS